MTAEEVSPSLDQAIQPEFVDINEENSQASVNSPPCQFEEEWKEKVSKNLSHIKLRVDEIFDILVSGLRRKENIDNSLEESILNHSDDSVIIKPLESQQELLLFEKKLEDKKTYSCVVRKLSQTGGENVGVTTRRILQRLMSDKLAQQYSYYGFKKKMVFSKLKISKVVFDGVRLNKYTRNCSNTEIESVIKLWLAQAKARFSYRNSCRLTVNNSTTCEITTQDNTVQAEFADISGDHSVQEASFMSSPRCHAEGEQDKTSSTTETQNSGDLTIKTEFDVVDEYCGSLVWDCSDEEETESGSKTACKRPTSSCASSPNKRAKTNITGPELPRASDSQPSLLECSTQSSTTALTDQEWKQQVSQTICYTQRRVDAIFDMLVSNLALKGGNVSEDHGADQTLSEPLTTHEQLLALERKLQDKSTYNYVVRRLSETGGDGIRVIVKRILQRLMSDLLAQQYSYCGFKQKMIFSELRLTKAIFDAVRLNKTTRNCSDLEIETAIKDWLRYAKTREMRNSKPQESEDKEN